MVFRSILPSLILCGVPPPSLAMIASPHPFDELQPDNVTRVRLRINGDDTFRYFSTEDGYTVVRDATDYYTYADRNATGHLVPTAYVVGTVLASGSMIRPPFRKGILPSRSVIRSQCRRCREEPERWRPPFSSGISGGGDMAAAVEGVVKNLVVMIRFKNHVNRQLPSRATVQAVMNGLDGDKISVRSAYKEMSYGKMDLVSVVTGWITVPGTEQYYADNNYGDSDIVYEMFYDSLNILKNRNFAFKNFDADGKELF